MKTFKNLSFEFYPPQTPEGTEKLFSTIEQLKIFNPNYVSVTFGAGGSTQERTLQTVATIQEVLAVPTAAHISCIASTPEKILTLLQAYQQHQIRKLVVLRGDIPSGMAGSPGYFKYAVDLVHFIRKHTGDYFYINVAAYPEFHPETTCAKQGLIHFQKKVNAGANAAITQYFFNADAYEIFLENCATLNISIPIVPGIMPITNYEKLQRFSNMCGAEIPRWLKMRLQSYANDPKSLHQFGVEVVSNLCEKLLALGAPGLHFYTLNTAETSMQILRRLISSAV